MRTQLTDERGRGVRVFQGIGEFVIIDSGELWPGIDYQGVQACDKAVVSRGLGCMRSLEQLG